MKCDYRFFIEHSAKRRRMFGSVISVEAILSSYFKSAAEAEKIVDLERREDGDLFSANGAYFKGGGDVTALEESLRTSLPEDFKQFYEQFGETVIITRTQPIWIYPLSTIIAEFEDDPDINIEEGRFFRFAGYLDPCHLGFRRDDLTDNWQVVFSTYGLLYSEMISSQGRKNVVAPSFYDWLKHLVETDGFPDDIAPRDEYSQYLTIVTEERAPH